MKSKYNAAVDIYLFIIYLLCEERLINWANSSTEDLLIVFFVVTQLMLVYD